jgi:coiled-coil and C2 domain-containing protein 1
MEDIPSTEVHHFNEEPVTATSSIPNQPQAERVALTTQFSHDTPIVEPSNPNDIPPPDPEQYGAPSPPNSILEALMQRVDKYKSEEAKAKETGNSSKARRMGRIVKQYEDAVKLHKSGRPFPRGDLPNPPGFAPIPLADKPSGPSASLAAAATFPGAAAASPVASSGQASGPTPAAATANQLPTPAAPSSGSKSPSPGKVGRQSSMMSVQEKQLASIEKRQKLFKEAALAAKQQGQTDTAKEYLRQALGLNKLIEVSQAGLPVDMSTLPTPPQLQQQAIEQLQ